MGRICCFFAVACVSVGVFVGASFMLPSPAQALDCTNPSDNIFLVPEPSEQEELAGTNFRTCFIENHGVFTFSGDILQQVPNPALPMSDYIDVLPITVPNSNCPGPVVFNCVGVTLTSDLSTGEPGLLARNVPVALEDANGVATFCFDATLRLTSCTGGAATLTIVAQSDADFTMPEPSTGLLLGSV